MKPAFAILTLLVLPSLLSAQGPPGGFLAPGVPSNSIFPVTGKSGRCYFNPAWAQHLGDSTIRAGCDWTWATEADPLTWPIMVLCELRTGDPQAPDTLADGTFIYYPAAGNSFRGTAPANCDFIAPHSKIATPRGEVNVETLKTGDTIYTASLYEDYETYPGASPDHSHRIGEHKFVVAMPLRQVRQLPIAAGQHIIRITLADGRSLEAFAGQMLEIHHKRGPVYAGTIEEGDRLDGSIVRRKERVEFTEPYACDILPYGDMTDLRGIGPMYGTSDYWANGILIKSGMWSWYSTEDLLRMGW